MTFARSNNLEKVKFWLKQGAYVNYWTAIDDETGHYREDVFEFGLKYAQGSCIRIERFR